MRRNHNSSNTAQASRHVNAEALEQVDGYNVKHWYALQITSDALQPARQRYVEAGPQGRRTFKSRDLSISVIDQTSDRLGLDIYVPSETITFIHRRTKKRMTKEVQLLPGYAFIKPESVTDYQNLNHLPGISGIMTGGPGKPPTCVPDTEVQKLFEAEAKIHQEYLKLREILAWDEEKMTKKQLAQLYKPGTRITIRAGHPLAGMEAVVEAVTGRKEVKAVAEYLGKQINTNIRIDQIEEIR